MPARVRRSLAPETDPRTLRQGTQSTPCDGPQSAIQTAGSRASCMEDTGLAAELAHGVYNFKDVWNYYKRLGWTTKPGPALGYDHYYIKPGKNPRFDVEGEDFFYSEAAIVRYAMKERIFGEAYQQPAASTPSGSRRRTSTSRRGSVSESTCNSEGEFDDDASTSSSLKRATTKPRSRLQQPTTSRPSSKEKQKRRRPGAHALDAISITSDSTGSCDEKSTTTLSIESSDEDESDPEFCIKTAVQNEEEDNDSDDDSDDDSEDSSSEEDPNDDDIVVVNAGILASKLKGNFQAKKRAPRPLLSTKKRKAGADSYGLKEESGHTAKKARSHATSAAAGNLKSEPKLSARTSQYAPASKPSAPTSASSGKSKRKPATPRCLSVETETTPATESRQSASRLAPQTTRHAPPPAASAPARASSAPSSPRHSFLSLQVPTASSGKQREATPSTQGSQVYVEPSVDSAPIESDNVGFEPDPEEFVDASFAPTEQTESAKRPPVVVTSATYRPVPSEPAYSEPLQVPAAEATPAVVHLQLDEVRFPSQQEQTYRVKISSTEVPKQTTIWMEHVQTREQRECTFSDIRMLDGEMTHQIPEKAIFGALVQCLRSSAAGDESQPEKFVAEEPGKVDLLHVDAHSMCLQLMFPCYEFWQKTHKFMMKLVPAHALLQSLVRELDETKRELVITQLHLSTAETKHRLLETECDQLRTLLHVYQDKEQAHQRLQKLHHQQQLRQELLKDTQEIKPPAAAPLPPTTTPAAQMLSPKKPTVSRKRDTRSFHARSGWLVSSNASTTLQTSPERSISWDSVLESAEKFYQITDEASRVVKVLQTGTYQLNLNVTHENSMGLGVWVRSDGADKTRKLEPTLVQFYDNKQRVSRLDQVVELRAGDHVSVHLLELSAQQTRSIWLDHFTPQPNIFFLTFLDHELVYEEQVAQNK